MPAWIWLLAFFVGVSVLALFGLRGDDTWYEFFKSTSIHYKLYSVAQLFTLDAFDLVKESNSWQVKTAAVLAPMVTIFAFLQLIWRDLRRGITNLMFRYIYSNHVIICGLGRRGTKLAKSALERGKRVVAIDSDSARRVAVASPTGRFHFIHSDALNPDALRKCGISRAGTVLVFVGDGHHSVALARRISRVIGQLSRSPERWARLICNASTSKLTAQAKSDQSLGDERGPIVEFYSPEQATSRQVFQQYPPESYPSFLHQDRPHVVIFGNGITVIEIVQQATVSCQTGRGRSPKITVVGHNIRQDNRLLEFEQREQTAIAEIQLEDVELSTLSDEALAKMSFVKSATQYIISMNDPQHSGEFVLRLRSQMEHDLIPVVPIMEESTRSEIPDRKPVGTDRMNLINRQYRSNLICSFGGNPDVLGWDYVVAAEQDQLAKTNHETYLKAVSETASNTNGSQRPAAVRWEYLSENYRFSNRSFVDHIATKLGLIDCIIVQKPGAPILTSDELNLLAEAEHARWCAEKFVQGWQYAPERNDGLRKHPDLVNWSKLPEDKKVYAVALIGSLETLLHSAGRSIKRVCKIGVSGHRTSNISTNNRKLCSDVIGKLKEIRRRYPDHAFVVQSSLAEGADQLVATLAMKHIGAELHSILPFAIEHYRRDFPTRPVDRREEHSASALETFHELLDTSSWAAELQQLPAGTKSEKTKIDAPSRQQRQYAQAGAYLAQTCDEMIFLWDGEPARGHGGTGDIVNWRQSGEYPSPYRRSAKISPNELPTTAIIIHTDRHEERPNTT